VAVHPLLNKRQNPFSKPKRRLSSALARRINSRALPRASALTGLASGKSSACAIDRECYFPTKSICLEGFFLLRDCEAVELRLKSSVAMTLGMSWVSLHGTERFAVGGPEAAAYSPDGWLATGQRGEPPRSVLNCDKSTRVWLSN
jgi:hypothetical protein